MTRETDAPVTFLPFNKTIFVSVGTRLTEAAIKAGLILNQPCGGEGICGKCRVLVQPALCRPSEADSRFFSEEEIQQGFRLGCQIIVQGPLTVVIPQMSLLDEKQQILVHGGKTPPFKYEDLPVKLSEFSTDNSAKFYVAAFDIGTTTLAGALLDATTGKQLGVVSRLNPQTRFGDDVISRILYVREKADGAQIMQTETVQAVNQMIGELCGQFAIGRQSIVGITFSGNTTMEHLLCRKDARPLGVMPFTPASYFGYSTDAADLGLKINSKAHAYIFPIIGGFVGGDIVAGILAVELTSLPGPALLVDIGTNGEIVLWANGKLSAASTAAGPAFEGARISCGMRGCEGAIEKAVVAEERLRIETIGHNLPLGICGSGLIDVAAELLRNGILSPQGQLRTAGELPVDVADDLRRRIVTCEDKTAFLLCEAKESGADRKLVLTQRDFRELQLAAGAIRAGIGILLKHSGLKPQDLDEVFLAGGFGNYIRRSNAQRIGLLPQHIERERISFRGNTSLAGASMAAVSQEARMLAQDLAKHTEHIDLSADPDFQNTFAEAMIFPEQ
jgi:uncharacterized 2Fe-2S/4Fe-4S cluster protein (DUF4445 family)